MAIIAKDIKKDYAVAPEGLYPAICVDVIDLGLRPTRTPEGRMKDVHKIRIVWMLDEADPVGGMRYTASQQYTLSLNKKAKLSELIESWIRPLKEEERERGIDLEKTLIGRLAQIQIKHAIRDQGTFANVSNVVPAIKGMVVAPPPPSYVRKQDRAAQRVEESFNPEELESAVGTNEEIL